MTIQEAREARRGGTGTVRAATSRLVEEGGWSRLVFRRWCRPTPTVAEATHTPTSGRRTPPGGCRLHRFVYRIPNAAADFAHFMEPTLILGSLLYQYENMCRNTSVEHSWSRDQHLLNLKTTRKWNKFQQCSEPARKGLMWDFPMYGNVGKDQLKRNVGEW